jgi:hypothetical protein
MVQVYCRKTDRGEKWNEDDVQKALHNIRDKEISVHKVRKSTAFHKQ